MTMVSPVCPVDAGAAGKASSRRPGPVGFYVSPQVPPLPAPSSLDSPSRVAGAPPSQDWRCSPFCLVPRCPCALERSPRPSSSPQNSGAGPKRLHPPRILPHRRHVFLCFKEPSDWPSNPLSSEWGVLPRALRAAVQTTAEHVGPTCGSTLTICEGRDDPALGSYNGDALVFPDMVVYRGLTRFDVQCFIDEALLGRRASRLSRQPLEGCHVFVCCQFDVASNCGATGPRVVRRFSNELAARGLPKDLVRVWRCCHLSCSGLPCMGNVAVFGSIGGPSQGTDDPGSTPSEDDAAAHRKVFGGDWYTGVTPDSVVEIVEGILAGQPVPRLLSASMLLPTPQTQAQGHSSPAAAARPRLSLDEEWSAHGGPFAAGAGARPWSPEPSAAPLLGQGAREPLVGQCGGQVQQACASQPQLHERKRPNVQDSGQSSSYPDGKGTGISSSPAPGTLEEPEGIEEPGASAESSSPFIQSGASTFKSWFASQASMGSSREGSTSAGTTFISASASNQASAPVPSPIHAAGSQPNGASGFNAAFAYPSPSESRPLSSSAGAAAPPRSNPVPARPWYGPRAPSPRLMSSESGRPVDPAPLAGSSRRSLHPRNARLGSNQRSRGMGSTSTTALYVTAIAVSGIGLVLVTRGLWQRSAK